MSGRGFHAQVVNASFMREAIRLSRQMMRRGQGGSFGTVVVRDDKIIAPGWNQVTSSNDPTAHAEIVAIRRACQRLKSFHLGGCELYTSCEPCPMCLAAIYWARIRVVYYGNSRKEAARIAFADDQLYREIALPVGCRKPRMRRVLAKEALAVFGEWERKPDKVAY